MFLLIGTNITHDRVTAFNRSHLASRCAVGFLLRPIIHQDLIGDAEHTGPAPGIAPASSADNQAVETRARRGDQLTVLTRSTANRIAATAIAPSRHACVIVFRTLPCLARPIR